LSAITAGKKQKQKEQNTMNNKELIKAWGNDAKRKSFLSDYKAWGEWVNVPELKTVYYKHTLPSKTTIIAMEHMHHYFEYHDGKNNEKWKTNVTYFKRLKGKPFSPDFKISESAANELLKSAKMKLMQDPKKKEKNS